MMVFEETAVPAAALPVRELKDHLRLGSGFADDGVQDLLLEGHLRAAMAAIEGRTAKVLLARRFRLELSCWRGTGGQALPAAPVTAVRSVTLVDAAGTTTTVEPDRWRLAADLHRPRLTGLWGALPDIPAGGRAVIVFDAGFGSNWGAVPPDLAQAMLLLAAEFYEHRLDAGQVPGLPMTVVALIERWRTVRVLGGGAG